MTDFIIKFENISKVFKLYNHPRDRLKEALNPFGKKYYHNYYALKDISFEVKSGESIGIIGKNGAGKSTLLKILTGVLSSSSGKVEVKGRIAALLELGAGFNPELSGIDNIYFQGAIQGFTRDQMEKKVPEIVAFADIGEFVFQSVKTYSSGMFARLAFAIAVSVEPEIFIVDEALAVGDLAFQEKSLSKLKEMSKQGVVIILVSHSLPMIRNFCSKAIWLDEKEVRLFDDSSIVCEAYKKHLQPFSRSLDSRNCWLSENERKRSIAFQEISVEEKQYRLSEDIVIRVKIKSFINVAKFGIGVIVRNSSGEIITVYNTTREDVYLDEKTENVLLKIVENDFTEGIYFLSFSIIDDKATFSYDAVEEAVSFYVSTPRNKFGLPVAEGYFRSKHQWIF